jgi:hypothetical protein
MFVESPCVGASVACERDRHMVTCLQTVHTYQATKKGRLTSTLVALKQATSTVWIDVHQHVVRLAYVTQRVLHPRLL